MVLVLQLQSVTSLMHLVKVGPGDLANAVDLIRSGEDIDFEGVAGSQEIDDNGDVLNSIEIWTVKGGKIESTNRFEAP